MVIEINYKILEDKLSRLNELFNNSKVDTQNEKEIHKKKIFSCKLCKIKISDKEKFKTHTKQMDPKIVSCEQCTKTFDENWKLEMHMQSHNIMKKFSCEECQQSFFLEW